MPHQLTIVDPPNLPALSAQYRASKADHERIRDRWQEAIVWAVDELGMTVPTVADLVGVTPARIQAIIARQYSIQQDNPAAPIPLLPAA